ncbi:hypothetical protein F4781DRAFT_359944 [Annulohypoxylon bovei var. microspora]|nr:hypothetical protein F4781DRAFT_359944 [Annulohypoxylon bovei var. microspora]
MRYDEAPELAPHNYPEVHHPPSVPEVAAYAHAPATPVKLEESTNPSTINAGYPPFENSTSPFAYEPGHIHPLEQERSPKRIWGCSVLVFILSVIIAILSAAVIGLAAGTGVEASRANDAEAKLASMSTSSPTTVTMTAPTSTPSDFSNVDKGCSTNSAAVTGTTYASQFFNRPIFKIYCNSDAPNNPLSSLFVGDFNDCMDACASYSFYIPSDFSTNATSNNATCAGVSYIPAWTNRTTAVAGDAPGNCYLKPGPQNQTALNNPNIGGSAVHAAILST